MQKISEKAVPSQAALSQGYNTTFLKSNSAMNLIDKVTADHFIESAAQTSVNVTNEDDSIYLEGPIQEGNINYEIDFW